MKSLYFTIEVMIDNCEQCPSVRNDYNVKYCSEGKSQSEQYKLYQLNKKELTYTCPAIIELQPKD